MTWLYYYLAVALAVSALSPIIVAIVERFERDRRAPRARARRISR